MASKKKKSSTRSSRALRMVYYFGSTKVDGRADQRTLLGGKGANLADMTSIGLPVPPGMTITTDTCAAYYDHGSKMPSGLMDQVAKAIKILEKETDKKYLFVVYSRLF